MRPCLATENLANRLAPDSKRVGYALASSSPTAAANLAHDVLCNLGFPVALPFGNRPLQRHVSQVCGACVPAQIGETVISGVPVVVASLTAGRTWANERRKDQTVDVVGLVNVVWEYQHHNLPPKTVIGAGAKRPPFAVSPLVVEAGQDASVCAGGISGVSGDVRVSNLSRVFWEWGECVCSHASDYTMNTPECAI